MGTGGDGENGEAGEGGITEDYEETFGGDGYVRYLDCGDVFVGVYMSKLIKFYTLKMCSLLCQLYLNKAVL